MVRRFWRARAGGTPTAASRVAAEILERRALLAADPLVADGTVLRPDFVTVDDSVAPAPPDYRNTPVTNAVAPGYQIEVVFPDSSLTASQQAVFTTAAARWQSVILGELSNVTFNGQTIDDLRISATAPFIDGVDGVLGQAGFTGVRSSNLLPFQGVMEFDSADVAALEAAGQLDEVILHEMGHVMGLGTLWSFKGLISGAGGADPIYLGAQGNAQYRALSGLTSGSAPIENTGSSGTRDSHWRESSFGNELMTGFLNGGANPISVMTIGQWADLGYLSVNINGFDPYARPGAITNAAPTIAALADGPDPAPTNASFTLTASGVADAAGGSISAVNFYRETNNVPGLQVIVGAVGDVAGDMLLGSDASSAGGYSLDVSTAGLANGTYTYYAQALDNFSLRSASVSTTHTVAPSVQTPAPGAPDLAAASDTGVFNTDNVTNRDNSSAAKDLQFTVGGTISGATVTLYADGIAVGSAVASGTTTTVTTNGVTDLADGARVITARQTAPGQSESINSPQLTVVVDTAAPTANVADVTEPRTTPVASVGVSFNQAVTGFDASDLTLTRDGVNVPLDASNIPTTGDGGITWVVPNLTAATTPGGTYVLTVAAGGVADVAGNLLAAADGETWVNGVDLIVVTDVFVAGSAWSQTYLNSLAVNGTGDPTFGFRINPAAQTDELPWSNLDTVSVRFSGDVNVSSDDLVVDGVNVATYEVADFAYDSVTFTATWLLAQPIPNDKVTIQLDADAGAGVTDANLPGNALDGEWTNPVAPAVSGDTFPSGDGVAGGDFVFNLRVLPGDINRDGAVNIFDFNILKPKLNQTGQGVTNGDINGDNVVNIFDFNDFKTYLGKTAPV